MENTETSALKPTVELCDLKPTITVQHNDRKRTSAIVVTAGPYQWVKAGIPGIYNEMNARSYFRQFPDRFAGAGEDLARAVARMFM